MTDVLARSPECRTTRCSAHVPSSQKAQALDCPVRPDEGDGNRSRHREPLAWPLHHRAQEPQEGGGRRDDGNLSELHADIEAYESRREPSFESARRGTGPATRRYSRPPGRTPRRVRNKRRACVLSPSDVARLPRQAAKIRVAAWRTEQDIATALHQLTQDVQQIREDLRQSRLPLKPSSLQPALPYGTRAQVTLAAQRPAQALVTRLVNQGQSPTDTDWIEKGCAGGTGCGESAREGADGARHSSLRPPA